MRVRRSPEQVKAARHWEGFVAANLARLHAAGLPMAATQSIAHWDDLLIHGHLDHHRDGGAFQVKALRDDQYALLVDLAESYFAAGYEYFTPLGLKVEDQERLCRRFGN